MNTIAATVTARYLTAHTGPGVNPRPLQAEATVHGFNVATWVMGSLLVAATIAGLVVNADRAPTPQAAQERTPEPVDTAM